MSQIRRHEHVYTSLIISPWSSAKEGTVNVLKSNFQWPPLLENGV